MHDFKPFKRAELWDCFDNCIIAEMGLNLLMKMKKE
jgi:hypothetical protein